MPSPGTLGSAVPYGDDVIARQQAEIRDRQREDAAARRLASSQMGDGGLLRIEGTLEVTGDLEVPSGALSSAGSMTAGTSVNAGTDVIAGADVHALDDLIADDDLSVGDNASIGGNLNMGGDIYSPSGRATPVTSSYVAAYLNGDGRLGATVSSERFKQDVEPIDPGALIEALRSVELVRFRYRAAVAEQGENAPTELGVIAEAIEAAGLGELVFRDGEGLPMGVAYERLCLPLIAAVQDLDSRLATLELLAGDDG